LPRESFFKHRGLAKSQFVVCFGAISERSLLISPGGPYSLDMQWPAYLGFDDGERLIDGPLLAAGDVVDLACLA
jgi:hypothetical protein